jgi:CTP:molybdopterin cytidylyltransferase MocA
VIEAIVLAAGQSSRMGRVKAGLHLTDAGDTFLWRLCRTLLSAGLPRITVVTGAHEAAVRRAWPSRDARVRLVHHPDWAAGQLSSILAGLDAIDDDRLEAMLVALVDVPLVRAATVSALVGHWRRTRAPIVRPSQGDRHGHPVIFDRHVFQALRAADLAGGAKPVVHAHRRTLLDVPVDDEGAFCDADTDADYARLVELLRVREPSRTRAELSERPGISTVRSAPPSAPGTSRTPSGS